MLKGILVGVGFWFLFGVVDVSVASQGEIDPSQIQRQLREELPRAEPEREPIQPIEPERSPAGLENVMFLLERVEVGGFTLYEDKINFLVEEFNKEYTGKAINLGKIFELRDRILALYKANKYELVRIILPAQDISKGVIKLEIIEGFIEGYEYGKATEGQKARLRPFLENIVKQRIATVDNIERNLILMNELAGYEVRGILKPGTRRGGTILVVFVNQQLANGFYEVNNWASRSVGPVRLQSGVSLNSLGDQGERITLAGATTLFDFEELRNASINFNIPIGGDGFSLYAGASYTETRPGDIIKPLKLFGRSFNFNIGLRYALIRNRKTSLNLQTGFELNNNTVVAEFVTPPFFLYMDRTRDIQFGFDFVHREGWGLTSGSVLLSQGLGALGARNKGTRQIPLSTEHGRTDAFRVNATLSQLFRLPAGFSFQLNLTGQYSSKPLLVANQFGLGGPNYNSAYVPSQIIGDSGYGLRLELQNTIRYLAGNTPAVSQPYLFFDYGQVFNINPPIDELLTQDIASAGFGLRQLFGSFLQMRFETGFPLVKFNNIKIGEPQIHFSIQSFF